MEPSTRIDVEAPIEQGWEVLREVWPSGRPTVTSVRRRLSLTSSQSIRSIVRCSSSTSASTAEIGRGLAGVAPGEVNEASGLDAEI